jgi:hypothetical protein
MFLVVPTATENDSGIASYARNCLQAYKHLKTVRGLNPQTRPLKYKLLILLHFPICKSFARMPSRVFMK